MGAATAESVYVCVKIGLSH